MYFFKNERRTTEIKRALVKGLGIVQGKIIKKKKYIYIYI